MMQPWRRFLRDEKGLSALETAIVLIAFVVVASVFAFTLLSAGTFSTERGKEVIYAGLSQVRGSLELKGGVVAMTDTTNVITLTFTVANVAGGEPIDLTPKSDITANNKVVINYRDKNQAQTDLLWTVKWLGGSDGDNLLEVGELAQIKIGSLDTQLNPPLGPNTTFIIEVKPPLGAVLVLERTTPPELDRVIDLR